MSLDDKKSLSFSTRKARVLTEDVDAAVCTGSKDCPCVLKLGCFAIHAPPHSSDISSSATVTLSRITAISNKELYWTMGRSANCSSSGCARQYSLIRARSSL